MDIPALGFDMAGEAAQSDLLILDVGGDEQGAIALGRYADVLGGAQGLEMLYVVNRCRKLTESPQEALGDVRDRASGAAETHGRGKQL